MLKKRLIGVVTIKDGWAVQSFGYNCYLPLGKVEYLVENLCHWGADEIYIQVIDRSVDNSGPDLVLLSRIARLGLETPLIYGGGIRSVDDGVSAIQSGADRLTLDAALHGDLSVVYGLANKLGTQALIASLPISQLGDQALWLNYESGKSSKLDIELLDLIKQKIVSEVLLIDWVNEGSFSSFNQDLIDVFPYTNVPLILFGGISDVCQISSFLERSSVSAVGVGNFLNYKEHSVQRYKGALDAAYVRAPVYRKDSVVP